MAPLSRSADLLLTLSEPVRSANGFQKPLVVEGTVFRVFWGVQGLISVATEAARVLPKAPSPAQLGEPTPAQGPQGPRTITWKGRVLVGRLLGVQDLRRPRCADVSRLGASRECKARALTSRG